MPRPSTSILRMPSASRSSLSHSTKVRSSMARVADRHHLVEPAAGDDEAADVLREMAREADDLARQRRDLLDARGCRWTSPARDRSAVPPPPPQIEDDSAPMVSSRQAEGLADLADGRASAIADHGGGDAGALAPVFAVDILNDLLAPLVLEIDVDVGRLAPLRRDEALEQEVGAVGIDLGDAETEADGGIGRRAAALAQDALAAREAHDVVDGEEIGRVLRAARSAPVHARCRRAPCRARRADSAAPRPRKPDARARPARC